MNSVENYLNTLERENGFSGSALVSLRGEVIFLNGYGYSNYEHLVRNTSNSIFCIGSITKQFTAASIFMLLEDGSLKANDKLKEYLPSLPEAWNQVTIEQLLTHTSGIPDFVGLVDWSSVGKCFHKPSEIIEMVADIGLYFSAGSNYSYCGTGYLLLGLLIEAVSGITYADFLKKSMFDKLALDSTGVLPSRLVLPNRAYGYEVSGNAVVTEEGFDMSFAYATGSLYSTVEDLERWSKAFFSGEVVSEASLEKMMTPTSLFSGYGSGLEVSRFGNRTVIGHKGGIGSFSSIIQNHISDELRIIVLCNVESSNFPNIDEIALKLADIVLDNVQNAI